MERNFASFLRSVLELAAVPVKSGSSQTGSGFTAGHLEVVYIRRCIMFIIRSTVGKMLSETSQIAGCKVLGILVAEQINALGKS